MTVPTLHDVLCAAFPAAVFDAENPQLTIGAFPEWDSLAHFNLLLLIEETYGVRFSTQELAELKSVSQIASALSARGALAGTCPKETHDA
jgi:acyl carrier protein